LNGLNVTVAEMNKISAAHHKNFKEDRLTLSAAKCRPMIVVSKNIRYAVHADMYHLVTKAPK